MEAKSIMVLAGEPSGDLHGANLCREILRLSPGTRLFGMGGKRMASAGVEIVQGIEETGVVGFWEVFKNLKRFRSIFRRLLGILEERRPSAVVLIDYPGFNLRFACAAHARGRTVIYYISPQVWAWGVRRVRKLKECVDKLVVIFEFEKEFFRPYALDAEFVGHPLLDALGSVPGKEEARRRLNLSGSPVIALLPGSRPAELDRHLPLLLESGELIRKRFPGVVFAVSLASSALLPAAEAHLKRSGLGAMIVRGQNQTVLAAADLALVTSGTATLEAAVLGTPMIIVYRLAFFSWLIARSLIKIPYIGLANVVYGKKIVPEYVQFDARPERIARRALTILENPSLRGAMASRLKAVREKLGTPGASERAARAVLAALPSPSRPGS
jgi:lipid-A-disaccharide synthase